MWGHTTTSDETGVEYSRGGERNNGTWPITAHQSNPSSLPHQSYAAQLCRVAAVLLPRRPPAPPPPLLGAPPSPTNRVKPRPSPLPAGLSVCAAVVRSRAEMWRRQQALLGRLPQLNAVVRSAWAGVRRYGPEGRKAKAAPLQLRGMVDRFRLRAKGGDGGNGCVSIRRSRSDRQGKPDGGNGGKGGDVILECSRSVWDFSSLQHHVKAGRGSNGVSKNMIGTRGPDKIAQVPVGTVIHLLQGEQPSVPANKPTRSRDAWDTPDAAGQSSASSKKAIRDLDPWDIPDAPEHSAASLNQIDNKMLKDSDAGLC